MRQLAQAVAALLLAGLGSPASANVVLPFERFFEIRGGIVEDWDLSVVLVAVCHAPREWAMYCIIHATRKT